MMRAKTIQPDACALLKTFLERPLGIDLESDPNSEDEPFLVQRVEPLERLESSHVPIRVAE